MPPGRGGVDQGAAEREDRPFAILARAARMQVYKNQHFLRRVRFAGAGIPAAWRSEHSLKFQCVALVCVLIAWPVLRLEPVWWAVVALTSGAVILAELFNPVLEHLADHLHPDTH